MHPITTKNGLSSALLNGTHLFDLDGRAFLRNIQSVEQESGGRKCWNVKGFNFDGKEECVFVKTID